MSVHEFNASTALAPDNTSRPTRRSSYRGLADSDDLMDEKNTIPFDNFSDASPETLKYATSLTDLEAQRATTRALNPRIKQCAYVCSAIVVVYIIWFLINKDFFVFPSLKEIDMRVLYRVKAKEALSGSVAAMWRGMGWMEELDKTVGRPVMGWTMKNGTVGDVGDVVGNGTRIGAMVRNGALGMMMVQGV
jgi:hypothetical protein